MKQLIYILLPFLARALLVMVVWLGGVVASRGVALVVVVVVDGVGLLALLVDRGYGLGVVVVGCTYA